MKAFFIEHKNAGVKNEILSEYIHLAFESTTDYISADVIISDIYSVNSALKIKEESGLPIVLVFFKSQQNKLFVIDTLCIDQLICVRDTPLFYNVPQLYPYEEVSFPILIHDNENIEKSLRKERVLVSLSDSMINGIQLYEVIRLLNKMTQYNITILCDDLNIESICNNHISVTDQFDKIEYLVKSNYCVIGSGIAAVLALMHQKHLIIIGDTGYGGIPTHNNILHHRQNYFQGAIGMALGAHIPSFLLYEDFERISDRKGKSKILKEELYKSIENDKLQIRDIVYRLINTRKSLEYKLNTTLEYRNVRDIAIVIQRFTNQILAELDRDCVTALKGIVNGQSMDKINPEAIQLLIENNIIVNK